MENNFEKQVQQKMDELSLTPSAPVWEGVQAAIHRKRDRRRLVLWLLPLLLLGGGISFLFFENSQPLPVAVQPSAQGPTETGSDGVTQQESNNQQNNIQQSNNQQSNKDQINPQPDRSQQAAPINLRAVKKSNTQSGSQQIPVAGVPVAKAGRKPSAANASGDRAVRQRATANASNDPSAKSQTVTEQMVQWEPAGRPEEQSGMQEHFMLPFRVNNITIEQTERTIKLSGPASSFVPDTITLQRPVLQARHTITPDWQWGLTARVGMSGTSSFSLTALKDNPSADFLASPATTSPPGAQAARPPSQPQRSLAFSAAVYVKRNMGVRTWLEGGLQYSYYSTSRTVGTKSTDTAVGVNIGFTNTARVESFYRNDGNATKHVNALHFIEVPIVFGYRPVKNIPLQLRHGISAGRYLAGTDLQYDGRANIYYESDESLRKMQWHVLSSLEYQVVKAKGFRAFAGPELQYGLTALKKLATSNQLFFAGLKTRFEF